MTKTEAAKQTLEDINPDVVFEEYTYNITSPDRFEHFVDRIKVRKLEWNGMGSASVEREPNCTNLEMWYVVLPLNLLSN